MKNKNSTTIVLTGGGTAGHCMPNFYLLPELKKHFDNIIYIGSKTGLERDVCQKYGVRYYAIDSCKLVRGKFWQNLKIPFVLIKSVCQCKRILCEVKPNIIFSKGGYVALPVAMAGRKLKIPVISHESDFSFGLANKLIMRNCNKMCVNYSHLANGDKIVYTGPILPDSFGKRSSNPPSLNLDKNKKTILVVGGSQGSVFLNDKLYEARAELERNYNVIHIVGKKNTGLYKAEGNYNVLDYSNNMSDLYAVCDIVLGRAGAGVIFESLYSHKPLLLVPLENKASRGDQLQNANYFAERGVVEIIRQNELSTETLMNTLNKISTNLAKYNSNIQKLNLPNGKDKTVKLILSNMKKCSN